MPFWKDYFVKGSKQDVTRVISLRKNGRKHIGVPLHPKQEETLLTNQKNEVLA